MFQHQWMSRPECNNFGHFPDFNADLRDAIRRMYYLNVECIDCTLQASVDMATGCDWLFYG